MARYAIRGANAAVEAKLTPSLEARDAETSPPGAEVRQARFDPQVALSHGQVIWLLSELGLRRGVSKSTFNHYVKSLRRLGIPFDRRKGTSERGPEATYNFEDVMELTVALLLRVYGTLPDVVTNGLRRFRCDLRPIYRQAYLDSQKRVYPAARVTTQTENASRCKACFLI